MLRPVIVAAVLLIPVSASDHQALAVNALKTCLADNTSGKDRKELAKWIFLAMAAHPEMKPHAAANVPAAADESSRTIAAMVTRLLTESCLSETKAVMRIGQLAQSMEFAFQGLGELAMQELMTDQAVSDSMGLFERYLDQKRMTDVFGKGQ